MIDDIKNDAAARMDKTLLALTSELTKVRTGRAHPSLLDHLTVEYYGVQTPLQQVANVSAEDARTLVVSPWENTLVKAVEKAIMNSGLGLNPVTAGTVIRVPMPPLTEERRRDLIRVVRGEAETARVAIRNIRRDGNNDLKDALKEKMISEDDDHRGQEIVQKLTDQHVKKVDELLEKKEADLMEV